MDHSTTLAKEVQRLEHLEDEAKDRSHLGRAQGGKDGREHRKDREDRLLNSVSAIQRTLAALGRRRCTGHHAP